MRFMLLAFLFMGTAFAQHSEQPLKEKNSDLRGQFTLFSIEVVQDKKIFILERTPNMDYFLRMRLKDEDTIRKISSRDANKVDMDFASRFLRCQYEHPASQKDCKVTLRLKMKGEPQDICEKDEKKSQEIVTFLKDLDKRF